MYYIHNFLTEAELTHLDRICTNRCGIFQHSFVEDDENNEVVSTERTSKYTYLNKAQDSVVRNVEARATEMVGLQSEYCEPLQIVSYTQGQKFETHHDAGTLLDDGSVELVAPRRLVTIFVYLNTLPEGQGHTEFPVLGLSVKPQRGCAVLFSNVNADGTVDARTVHRAAPVAGRLQKYGMNIWLCDQSFQALALVSKNKRESKADNNDIYSKAMSAGGSIGSSAFIEADKRTNEFLLLKNDNTKSGDISSSSSRSTGKKQGVSPSHKPAKKAVRSKPVKPKPKTKMKTKMNAKIEGKGKGKDKGKAQAKRQR